MRSEVRHNLLLTAAALALAAWVSGSLAQPQHAAAYADNKRAGAEVFATSGCAHCHGNDGQGTEKGPNLHDLRRKSTADKIQNQIVHGGGEMPAFGEVLKPEQIGQLVDFLRAKKWITPPQPTPTPPSTR